MHSLQRREKSTFETIPPHPWGQVLNPYAWGKRSVPSEQIKTVTLNLLRQKKNTIFHFLQRQSLVSEESMYEPFILRTFVFLPPKIRRSKPESPQ